MAEPFRVQEKELILRQKASIKINQKGSVVIKFGKQVLEVVPRFFRVNGEIVSLSDLHPSNDSLQLDG